MDIVSMISLIIAVITFIITIIFTKKRSWETGAASFAGITATTVAVLSKAIFDFILR